MNALCETTSCPARIRAPSRTGNEPPTTHRVTFDELSLTFLKEQGWFEAIRVIATIPEFPLQRQVEEDRANVQLEGANRADTARRPI
jgi:hypothetical protein